MELLPCCVGGWKYFEGVTEIINFNCGLLDYLKIFLLKKLFKFYKIP